jgi:phage shock protein PspC (stress-responsive transcriptional regulator)
MIKKLHRIDEGKMIFGVCTGLADYFNADVTIVRLIAAASCCFGGSGLFLYIIAGLLMPPEDGTNGTNISADYSVENITDEKKFNNDSN